MFVPHQLLGSPLGGTLILECLTEAHPRPITFWTRTDANNVNGIMLLPSKRLRLDTLLVGYQTQMKLHIHQVEAQDIGHYKCVSKNSLDAFWQMFSETLWFEYKRLSRGRLGGQIVDFHMKTIVVLIKQYVFLIRKLIVGWPGRHFRS